MADADVFWFDDYTILYKDKRYLDFIPKRGTILTDQLNALARIAIIATIIFIFTKNNGMIPVALTVLVMTIVIHRLRQ